MVDRGTTSACAENTGHASPMCNMNGNYLRVRGEYEKLGELHTVALELPPRARRIPPVGVCGYARFGTTSACAENTVGVRLPHLPPRNYLRVRGEYIIAIITRNDDVELPPRARRIHSETELVVHLLGTTSACAENTPYTPAPNHSRGNYLRVRGEYSRWRIKSS